MGRSIHSYHLGLTFLALLAVAGCGGGGTEPGPNPAISLSVNPTSATVVQGGSTQTTGTLTRSGGFTGAVTFTVEGAPAGVTGSVGNIQTSGGTSTATVTIQVGASVAPGTYTITVRATGSGVSPATAAFQLTVTAIPSFSLSISPAGAISLLQGNQDNSRTINIARTNYSSAITLTAEGLPNGVTAAFAGNPVTGTSSVMTLTATAGAALGGPVTVTVRGTGPNAVVVPGGAVNLEATVTFQITITGFALGITPAGAISLQHGNQDNSKTITIARTNYGSAITLTAEGLPNGVTAAFAGNPVGGTSSVMTLTATAGAALGGPVTVTVRGTGPNALVLPGTNVNLEATVTFQLTITAAGSFTLAITPPPATLSVPIGTSNNSKTVIITRTNYTQPITLSAEGLPIGVTADFAGNPVTGTSSVMTITAQPNAATAGPVTITVRGTGPSALVVPGGVAHLDATTTLALTIAPPIFTGVAVGEHHGCGRATDNAIYCWGRNTSGQLGIGTITTGSAVPVKVAGGHSFKAVHSGGDFTCGITTDDRGFCWGDNDRGQLADGTAPVDQSLPREIGGDHRWATLGAGEDFMCGITTPPFPFTYCWGEGDNGQIGDGVGTDRAMPTIVGGGAHVFASLGRYGGDEKDHMCGIRTDGSLYCWGANGDGQLGLGGLGGNIAAPTLLGGGPYVHTAQAEGHSCAIRTSGTTFCWGKNTFGQLGDGTTTTRTVPTQVLTVQMFSVLGPADSHTCAVNTAGAGFCWGLNDRGQLGNGTFANSLTPVAVSGGHVFTDIRGGQDNTCALRNDGRILCWGSGQENQLGDGTGLDRNVPTLIAFPLVAPQASPPR